jgi:uncharacterized RDD family membrane protein YckC
MLVNKLFFRRISAYIADFLLVSFIVALFSEVYIINPFYNKYMDLSNEYLEYVENIDLKTEILNLEKLDKYTYELSYYSVYISIITLVVNILYYVIFQYFNNGKTIGKALFKIRVKGVKNQKLNIFNLFIRYCILMGVITSLISIISLFVLSMNTCLNVLSITQILENILFISCILMVFFRKDNRGLHDLLSNTCIVDDIKCKK